MLRDQGNYILSFNFNLISILPSIFSNNKLWPDDEQMSNISSPKSPSTPTSPPVPPSRERSDSGIQQSTVDEENTTDWIPEIPFENVNSARQNFSSSFKNLLFLVAPKLCRFRRRHRFPKLQQPKIRYRNKKDGDVPKNHHGTSG